MDALDVRAPRGRGSRAAHEPFRDDARDGPQRAGRSARGRARPGRAPRVAGAQQRRSAHGSQPAPAPPGRDLHVDEAGGRRRARVLSRGLGFRGAPPARGHGLAGRLRAQPAALPLRAGGARVAGPGVPDLRPRRRLGHRVGPGGSAPTPVRAGEGGTRRGRGRDEGAGHGVRRAHGRPRGGHVAAPAGRSAGGRVRRVPAREPVDRGSGDFPKVGRARDDRERADVHGDCGPLRRGSLRGHRAALPDGRVPSAAPDRAGRADDGRAALDHCVAVGADPRGGLLAAGRVGGHVHGPGPLPRVRGRRHGGRGTRVWRTGGRDRSLQREPSRVPHGNPWCPVRARGGDEPRQRRGLGAPGRGLAHPGGRTVGRGRVGRGARALLGGARVDQH